VVQLLTVGCMVEGETRRDRHIHREIEMEIEIQHIEIHGGRGE
jgi:hypothetical protein